MTGASTTVASAAALALVLQFAMLRAARPMATLNLLRLHVAAAAVAAASAGFAARGSPVDAGVMLGGAVLLAGLGLRVRGVLRRLDTRTGGAESGLAPGSMWSVASIALGLGLTALAVLCVSAFAPGAAAVQRQGMAFGLASVLVGMMAASRPGRPAPTLARLVAVSDGLVLLACAARAPAGPTAAALLLAPAVLVVAVSVLGRAGGLPAAGEEGWR
jgi:hypothetical protein